jgi:hypothetical protein
MAAVDTIISDMALFHDNPCAVLETLPGWGSGASSPESVPAPATWTHCIPWTHIMREARGGYLQPQDVNRPWRLPIGGIGNTAGNTRVQQAHIQMWWLLVNGTWVLSSYNPKPGAVAYPYNWSEYEFIDAFQFWRDEAIGTSMADLGASNFDRLWHAFGSAVPIPANAIGCVTAYYARKIKDNDAGVDDRDDARILGGGAGDWYRSAATADGSDGAKIGGVNVSYMGFSRLKYITNDWQLFAWYTTNTLTQAQLRANPPPLVGLDLLSQTGGTDGPVEPGDPYQPPIVSPPLRTPLRATFMLKTTSGENTFGSMEAGTSNPGKPGRGRRPRILFY